MFIHDALCDYITCGDTRVPAHELRVVMATFEKFNQNTRRTGFQEQFVVSITMTMQCGVNLRRPIRFPIYYTSCWRN